LQQVALVALRTLIGWHFLYEGIYKFRLPGWSPDGHPMPAWSSLGFVKGVANGPVGALAQHMAEAGYLGVIDKLLMYGIAAVGLSLILGIFTRVGCIGGVLLLCLFYVLNVPVNGMHQNGAEGAYLFVNKTLIEAVAVLALYAFDTGRIAGLDRFWHDRRQSASARQ
jgi:thiosulfate dehydrogenase [quinone] large subunit